MNPQHLFSSGFRATPVQVAFAPRSIRIPYCLTSILLLATLMISGLRATAGEGKLPTSQQRLTSSVEYLSDDAREGRGVGTKGLDMAAAFIAKEFSRLGLKTDLYAGSPFQEFTIVTKSEMGAPKENRLQFKHANDGSLNLKLSLKKDFTPLAIGGSGPISTGVIFVGYGITAPKLKYDDYQDLDVKGKVRGHPPQGTAAEQPA